MRTPGVELKTIDRSDFISNINATAFGICVKSNKGPLDLTSVSSQDQFTFLYGEPDINVSESHYHALELLSTGNNILYCSRVQNKANYAGCIFYQDKKINPTKIEFIDFPYGVSENYESSGFRVILLNLSRPLIQGETVSVLLNDSDNQSELVSQEFIESSNNTLQIFSDKIKQKLKEIYNVDAGVQVKINNSNIAQPEIKSIKIESITREPEKLEISVTNFTEGAESYSISFNIKNVENLFELNLTNALTAVDDFVNQINTEYSSLLSAQKDSGDSNKFIITAIQNDRDYFSNISGTNVEISYEVVTSYDVSVSLNVPQIAEAITVSTNYETIPDILLNLSTKLNVNYGDYLTALVDEENNSLTLVAKQNYNGYFTNITTNGLISTITTIQEGFGVNSNTQIVVIPPISSSVLYQNLTIITKESISVEQEIIKDTELFNVFAENPGSWGNDIGVFLSVTQNDLGIKEAYTIKAKKLATGVQFLGSFDIFQLNEEGKEVAKSRKTYNINGVFYTISNEKFLEDVKNELERVISTTYLGYEGVVLSEGVITIQAPKSGLSFDFSKLKLTGVPGLLDPELIVTKEIYNTTGTKTFTLSVVNQNNLTNVLESYHGSLYELKDSSNNQLNISELVNNTSASSYIRVKQFSKSEDSGLEVLYNTEVNMLSGGDNGLAVIPGNYIQAISKFDQEDLDIFLLIDDGYNDVTVKQELTRMAEKLDAVALLSVPKEYSSTTAKLNDYRLNKLGINSCYGALLGPAVEVLDNYTGNQLELTTGGFWAERNAYVESTSGRQNAVAGAQGTITGILGLSRNYKRSEYGEVYPNQVNLIRNINGAFQIDGIKTLQKRESALQKLPKVLVKNMVAKKLKSALEPYVYQLNTTDLRQRVVATCSDYLNMLKNNDVLGNYRVICDATNNSAADVDAGRLNVAVYISFVGIVEEIYIDLVLSRTEDL